MKLALIRQRYNAYGGAERFVEQAVAALAAQSEKERGADSRGAKSGGAERGAVLTLVARQWDVVPSGDSPPQAKAGADRIQCDPFYLGRTWRDWSFARAACAATSGGGGRGGFDLVQSHERIACCDIYRAGDGVHAQWLANRARARGMLANFAASLSPWHRYTLAAEQRLFQSPRLRAVICNSRMVAAEIRARFGLAEEKLRIIYNGVDTARFHPGLKAAYRQPLRRRLGIPERAFVYLLVGSGFERKGVPQLLCAAARLSPEAHVVVGADRKLDAYRARAVLAQGVCAVPTQGARLHFVGPRKDIEQWYAMADCFVLPTLYDPFPNAAMEAMASGLPIITSRQCGAAELVEPAGCGWVCDALDETALHGLMAKMSGDEPSGVPVEDVRKMGNEARQTGADARVLGECAREMGERARALAEQYTLEAMAEQLLALYRELLGGGSGRG